MWMNNQSDNFTAEEIFGMAKEYETLKLHLWKKYEHNRNAYTDAKTDFISKWTVEARKGCGDRY